MQNKTLNKVRIFVLIQDMPGIEKGQPAYFAGDDQYLILTDNRDKLFLPAYMVEGNPIWFLEIAQGNGIAEAFDFARTLEGLFHLHKPHIALKIDKSFFDEGGYFTKSFMNLAVLIFEKFSSNEKDLKDV